MAPAVVTGIGFLSTACICVTLLPQIVLTIRTKSVANLSLATYLIYDIGNIAGWVYGAAIGSWPVIATSAITTCTSALMTVLILIQRTSTKGAK